MANSFIKTKFFVVAGTMALFLSLSFLGRELYKKYQIRQDVRNLEAQAAKIEGQNQGLLELINYLKTPEYKERQARAVLNLQKPGEIAVALPGTGNTEKFRDPLGDEQEATGEISNFKKWWNYFFAK